MIGQNFLLKRLEEIKSLDELPKSIIINGDKGSGKHTFANEISNKFGIKFEHINYELTTDILNDMHSLSIPKFYLIDFDEISKNKRVERFQNTLLKFVEEPPMFAWVILLITDLSTVLETIKNRCQIYRISPYTLDELKEIGLQHNKSFSSEVLRVLRTPGNVVSVSIDDVNELFSLGNMIISSISKATPSNALSISKKFDGDNAFKLELFTSIFSEQLLVSYMSYNDERLYKALLLTKEFQNSLKVLNINKKYALDNYLLRLKSTFM